MVYVIIEHKKYHKMCNLAGIMYGHLNSIKVILIKNDLNDKKISNLYSIRYGFTAVLTINKFIYF